MKNNSYPFALSNISDLLDNKLAIWADKIKFDLRDELGRKIDQSATGIIAEMDKRFAEVYDRFDEVDRRFDVNDDAHQEVIGAIDEIADRKIEQHVCEKHSFISV